jgi:phage terminase large subunit-like protein
MQITLFTPHLGQRKVIDGFADSEHKFGIVACGRQFGKSLLAQNLMLYWALKNPKQKCGWISPIFTQSRKVFKELEAAAHKLIKSSNKAELTIELINGSTM